MLIPRRGLKFNKEKKPIGKQHYGRKRQEAGPLTARSHQPTIKSTDCPRLPGEFGLFSVCICEQLEQLEHWVASALSGKLNSLKEGQNADKNQTSRNVTCLSADPEIFDPIFSPQTPLLTLRLIADLTASPSCPLPSLLILPSNHAGLLSCGLCTDCLPKCSYSR